MFNRRLMLITLLSISCAVSVPSLVFAKDFTSARIGVRSVGAGSDVILIPGLASSPRVWAEMLKAIPGHRYHMIQVSGFAGQPFSVNSASGDGLVAAPVAEEIARYIAEQGLQKPAVIGHSLGGTIGMMLAARHPQAISSLMVVDMLPFLGALFGPPGTTASSIQPTADFILANMRKADPAARQQTAQAALNGMIDTVAMRAGAIEDSVKSDADVNARAYHELIVTDLTPELAKIVVPVTVLYVLPKGIPFTETQMDAYYQAAYAPLKGVMLKRIPASAHFIMWDQPEQFQNEVKNFLK